MSARRSTVARVRRPTAAGPYYPSARAELLAAVTNLLDAAPAPAADVGPPIALVVPHAGYRWSGAVAAATFARLRPWRERIRRVVVIGPSHRMWVRGLVLSSADAFETPLGLVELDAAARHQMLAHPRVAFDDRAHRDEHSLEVQLPFLQVLLGDGWQLLPVLAGEADPLDVADVLAPLWGAPDTVVVVSTDLSHHHHARTAQRLDARTASMVVAGRWEELAPDDACGATALRGALELSRRRHEVVELVDLRTSADAEGTVDRVVGYGGFVVR